MGVDKIHDLGDWGGRGLACRSRQQGFIKKKKKSRKDKHPKHTEQEKQGRDKAINEATEMQRGHAWTQQRKSNGGTRGDLSSSVRGQQPSSCHVY